MNTIEALEYLRNNPKAVVVKRQEESRRQIEMNVEQDLFDWNKLKFVQFKVRYDSGTVKEVDFSEWVKLDDEWEVKGAKEVKYYVKIKPVAYLANMMDEGCLYLNYSSIGDKYFLSDKHEVSTYFQTSFTRDEIEEFGIAHPEVGREYLEFIEVVSE